MAYRDRGRGKRQNTCDCCSNKLEHTMRSIGNVRLDLCDSCFEDLNRGEKLTDCWGFEFQVINSNLICRRPVCGPINR